MVIKMVEIITLIILAAMFGGCYTELMRESHMVENGRQYHANDTSSDSAYSGNTGVQSNTRAAVVPCNCTPWEIQTNSCWCTCDRCGLYHKVGYEYCPTGIYSSYWGWDYYERYPWWVRKSYEYRRRPVRRYYERDSQPPYTPPSNPPVVTTQERPSKGRNEIQVTPINPVQPKISTDTSYTEKKVIETRERPSKNRNQID
jgi:hypothetical protein